MTFATSRALIHQGDGPPSPRTHRRSPIGRASDGGSGGMAFGLLPKARKKAPTRNPSLISMSQHKGALQIVS